MTDYSLIRRTNTLNKLMLLYHLNSTIPLSVYKISHCNWKPVDNKARAKVVADDKFKRSKYTIFKQIISILFGINYFLM